jgi:uncharacterized protein (DUF2235 family)
MTDISTTASPVTALPVTALPTTAVPVTVTPTPTRNIVLCLDGTSNKFAAVNTNVVKLYAMLDRARPDQLSYYQPGIGTMAPPGVWGKLKRWFIKQLDLAIAWLLSDHVTDAYRFLMRYYQKGDRIFIFGFSRGAYTARALAGLIAAKGLLDATKLNLTDKVGAYRLGAAVWYEYLRSKLQAILSTSRLLIHQCRSEAEVHATAYDMIAISNVRGE